LLLDILLDNAQRCPATTGGEVGRRPQDIVPIAFLHIRAFGTKQATGNPFEAVDQARHRVLWRVVDEQVHVFGFAIHLDQLSLEVAADLPENGLKPLVGVFVKHLSSIFCNEDQVDM
jgi:hypothetical protein